MSLQTTTPVSEAERSAATAGQGATTFEAGHQIGRRYKVIRHLGQGGIGVVYQVEHLLTKKIMALKVLHVDMGKERDALRRFQKEIQRISRLSHPHAISVFDCGVLEGGDLFIVMEYLPGIDLGQLLRSGLTLPWKLAVTVGLQSCHALEHAHAMGLFHRNLKPANMMLLHYHGENDFVKLLDFGLTTAIEQASGHSYHDERYEAPEFVKGKAPTSRADVYSLGTVLYELLTRREYEQDHKDGKVFAHEEQATEVVQVPVPPQLREVVLKAVHEDPKERFDSMASFAAAIEQARDNVIESSWKESKDTGDHPAVEADATPSGKGKGFSMPSPAEEVPKPERILTRQEWDDMERNVRWQVRKKWGGLLVVLLAIAGYFGVTSYQKHTKKQQAIALSQKAQSEEREPNNTVLKGTLVHLNQWIKGQLGKKTDDSTSDQDWYRFEVTKPSQVVTITVQPPKLLDVFLGLYKVRHVDKGRYQRRVEHLLVTSSNVALRGKQERILNYKLPKGKYYILVRESIVMGESPQENLGAYRLFVKTVKTSDRVEIEPNNLSASALKVPMNKEIQGYHQQDQDIDYFRMELPSLEAVRSRWAKNPPKKKRSKRLAKFWPDYPLYKVTFYPVDKIRPKVLVLNEEGRGITVVKQYHGLPYGEPNSDDVDDQKTPLKKGEKPHISIIFGGKGTFFLRVTNAARHHLTTPYRWKIEPLDLK